MLENNHPTFTREGIPTFSELEKTIQLFKSLAYQISSEFIFLKREHDKLLHAMGMSEESLSKLNYGDIIRISEQSFLLKQMET